MIAAGAFGENVSCHLIYMGYLWGWFLSLLYQIMPGINIFFWSMYLLNIAAISSICFLAVRNVHNSFVTALITLTINLLLRTDAYLNLQYTKSSYLYCAAGLAWYCVSILRSRHFWMMGSVFFTLGYLFRADSFYLGAAFGVVFLIAYIILKRPKAQVLVRGLFPLFVFLITAWGLNTLSYSSSEWQMFRRFNNARTILEDHVGIDYEAHKELYDSAGISDLQARMMDAGLYIDSELTNADALQAAAAIESGTQQRYQFNYVIMADIVKYIYRAIQSALLPKAAVALLLIVLVSGNREERIISLGTACMVIGIYWYFVCGNRVVWRAEFGAWLFLLLLLLFCSGRLCVHIESSHSGVVLSKGTALLVLITFLASMAIRFRTDKDMIVFRDRGSKLPVYISTNQASDATGEFIFGRDTEITMNPVEITRTRYGGLFRNYCFTGSWIVGSPTGLYYARKTAGIEGNPVRALIERENTYYAGDVKMAELLEEDLERIYGVSVMKTEISEERWQFRLVPLN